MTPMQTLQAALRARLPQLELREREPMARHTSFKVGGPVALMALPKEPESLPVLLRCAWEAGVEPFFLGRGSNLLVSDQGAEAFVVKTAGGLDRLERTGETALYAGAGATLAQTAVFAANQGLTGLEFAHGIPGTVGGGVCMNAGAYGGELKQVVHGVSALFPEEGVKFLTGEELSFGYRRSFLTERPEAAVLYAVFRLSPGDPEAIRETQRSLMARRKASQPLELPSAGSTFKRPEGYFAGTLIDQCGLKGMTVGGAQVSEKHGGFIVNRGGATCAEIRELIRRVQEAVLEQTGVRLEPEVRFVD